MLQLPNVQNNDYPDSAFLCYLIKLARGITGKRFPQNMISLTNVYDIPDIFGKCL